MEHIKVGKWGNSLAIRLPGKFAKKMGIKDGDLLPPEVLSYGAIIRAQLDAKREANRMTREEATAAMIESRKHFPKHLRPEDWKIDRSDPDMRG